MGTVLGFQVTRKVVRALYHSGLYIDITEIIYHPTPKDLGEKKHYRIELSLSENCNKISCVERFDNEKDAVNYTFSDEFVEKAKAELEKQTRVS